MKYNLDELKKEYIGKEFGWLTVLDVYPGGKNIGTMFACLCKCGNQIEIAKRKVISGHTKSCGCYKQSKEYGTKLKRWYCEHPEECTNRSVRTTKYYENNPERRNEQSDNLKMRRKKHPEMQNKSIEANKLRCKQKRISSDYSCLIPFVHPDFIDKLCNGDIRSEDFIYVKCRICNLYEYRVLKNLFNFSSSNFHKCVPPICQKCKSEFYSSKVEQEIEEFIKSFYDGEIVRNTRSIISPQELDIYIPEKKIAIEFNGDYWHSDKFKDKEYHYNKYKLCKDKGIILVSIFESEWNSRKNEIKEYLIDLFNGKENKLSFNDDKTLMNNNYPIHNTNYNSSIIENYYQFNDSKVFTCGFSKINI